jgi:hypothetical protein
MKIVKWILPALLFTTGASAQSLLNNGNQPGGNGGIIGSQGPGYSANPRDRYVPGQNNQTPYRSSRSNGNDQRSGSTFGGQQSGSIYGSQPR